MTRIPRIAMFVGILVTALGITADADDIADQKSELEEIRGEVVTSQQRLDSLQQAQSDVQKAIANYEQKMQSDNKLIRRLRQQLRELNADISTTEDALAQRTIDLERQQRRYLGSLRQFYLSARTPAVELLVSPASELRLHRQKHYLAAVAGMSSGQIATAEELLSQTRDQLEDLSEQSGVVSQLKQKRETSLTLGQSRKAQKEKQLTQIRQVSRDEAERIMMLQTAAEEMTSIIARLESERRARDTDRRLVNWGTAFAELKGHLPAPFRGRVTVPYGPAVDPITNLRSFSPGISIKGRAGDPIRAVAEGIVVYSGNLRGYGAFVILQHEGDYYTTYAGLSGVAVERDQRVLAEARLGSAGDDGLVKFELRNGRETLDPVTWIRFDAF